MEYPHITSRQNKLVRQAAALAGDGEKRRESGMFMCEGARLCRDGALSGLQIETCFFTSEAGVKYREYLQPVFKVCREAYQVESHVAQLLSSTKNSQGVFCVCRIPLIDERPFEAKKGPCLVLESIQDPGNLGTVLRTAEAMGVKDVFLLGDCCDPLSPKVLRASMGAVFRERIGNCASAGELCDMLKAEGYALHAAVVSGDAKSVTEVDFSTGCHALFIGNEGNGLTRETIACCGDSITIPMAGRAESLNASAAATILLWEMSRCGSN